MVRNCIRRLRIDIGVTQVEFARVLQVTRQTVIAIETGKYNPSLELALKISRYFGKPVEEVFQLIEDGEQ